MSEAAKFFKGEVVTAKIDRKNFNSSNQAHYCWQKYNEFVLCMKKTGGDEEACTVSRAAAVSVCPDEWYKGWDDARAEGKFLGIQEHGAPAANHHH